MKALKNILNYYADCYAADLKAVSILDFYSTSVEHQLALDTFDLHNGKVPNLPIDSVWGETVDTALALHSKEKQLYVGTFFLKGKSSVLGRSTRVFAPLFLHDLTLYFEQGVYYVNVDLDNPILNPAFLQYLKSEMEIDSETETNFINALPTGKLDFETLVNLKKDIENLLPKLDASALSTLIANDSLEVDLETIARSRSVKYKLMLLAGSAIGLAQKSKGAQGVIQEIDIINRLPETSVLLKQIFGYGSKPALNSRPVQKHNIYTISSISTQQKKVFLSLKAHDMTMVIGPPGTGKTFTIANLAAHLIGEGKSTLIVCKTVQACKVVMAKIQNDLGIKSKLINATTKRYKYSLQTKLNKIIYGIKSHDIDATSLDQNKKYLDQVIAELASLVKRLIKVEKDEIKWGELYFSDKNKFLKTIVIKWIEYKKHRKDSLMVLAQKIRKAEKQKKIISKKHILKSYDLTLRNSLKNHRAAFITLTEALSEETGNLIHDKFNEINFDLILNALPVWVCTANNLHNTLPLQANLFDTVIIDEASQCDIPSAIPLLYRAKKLVIVGDNKQLRHVSFLSRTQELKFRAINNIKANLPYYRSNSVLDLVNKYISNQDQVIFLDEHYRSVPAIIDFSNKNFYDSALQIMTDKPSLKETDAGLSLYKVTGCREPNGTNPTETRYIINYIKEIIKSELTLDKKHKCSIGIISPFRAQVNLIKKEVRKTFTLNELKHHDILIGTPHQFQGEEREVICISFVVDNNTHHGSIQYLNKEDVFNVCITRAKKLQVVFTSIDYKTLSPKYLLSRYLNSIIDQGNQAIPPNAPDDNFANEVSAMLTENIENISVTPNFIIGGLEIDLLVTDQENIFCIDLIGYPGDFAPMFSQAKIRMLERMNYSIYFLAYSDWHLDREKSIKNLLGFLT